MKNKYIKYAMQHICALMLVMLTGFMTQNVNAQTIDGFTTIPPDVTYYVGDDTDASIDYMTSGAFDVGTVFYLHTGAFEEDNVIGTATGTGANTVMSFTWPYTNAGGTDVAFTLTAATGDFDAETFELDPALASVAGGTYANPTFNMNGTGLRRVTFQPLNTDFTEEVVLNVSFNDFNAVVDRPIVVQYSVDGTNFLDMTDTNTDNEWFGTGALSLQFVLTSGQKDASVTFRVLQKASNSLTSGNETWTLDGSSVSVAVGGVVEVSSLEVGQYNVFVPSVAIASFLDENDAAATEYYAGQATTPIKILGTYTGADGRVNDYNYLAVFTNGNDVFTLESATETNDGTSLVTVTGIIPADIDYGNNWDVELLAYTTTTPILGYEFETNFTDGNQTDLVYIGGSVSGGKAVFNQDNDRSLSSAGVNVGTVTNSSLSFLLKKESVGLSPTGTEIEVSFSTNGGSTYTVLEEISLNADLSDPVMVDSWPAGTVSSSTIFRISQKSNNGSGLSTWSVDDLTLSVGGNVVNNDQIITYVASSIDVFAPVIALEPVNVPSGLIYPGDNIDLTYNITAGAYPAGTTITAIFEPSSDNPLIIGTSTLITPGVAQDHTISVAVPSFVGGTYSIHLIPSTDSDANSNAVSLPIYNTTLTITTVTSNSGVLDGGLSVIYPGDMITVNYVLDGAVGTGAELMLEILDWDQDTDDNDGYVFVNSISTGISGGVITGTLPTDINFDNGGAPMIRLKIGNGVLATSGLTFAEDENGNDANSVNMWDDNFYPQDLVVGNYPEDILLNNQYDCFIGSGERSTTTIPFDYSFGGTAYMDFDVTSFDFPINVYLQGSVDGTTWIQLDEEEYTGANFSLSAIVPASLWSATTRFRFIYNEDGASGELENIIDFGTSTFQVNATTSANTVTYDISSQFRKPTVNLEVLDSYSFTVGESLTIEYTTEGPFPANTAFAIVLEGPDNLETVVGNGTGTGLTSVSVTMPSFAFEDNPTDTDQLYNNLKVVAYDATGGAVYAADETIVLDDDEFFITIEGTDDENGTYAFDEAGDRSLLTEAFDVSGSTQVLVNFTTSSLGVSEMDNILTLPVFQVSTDAGATFTNVAIEEDGVRGDGYIFKSIGYEAEIPSGMITAATQFRWYQPLNLGAGTDAWTISGISITLVTGNEISTYYSAGNSDVASTLSHPNLAQFTWTQENADTDPIFNGEAFTYAWDKVFQTTKLFPTGTQFDFILHDGADFIMDPSTDKPYIIASTTVLGSALSAEIPFFVEEGSYTVRLIASIPWEDDLTYFYAGMEDGTSTEDVGTVDVFLRAVRTSFVGDKNATLYAGSDVTFSINLENDDLNSLDTDALFANLIVNDGSDDWLLAAPQGIADITTSLPPFMNGNLNFRVELSENAPIGIIGEIIENNPLSTLEDGYFGNGDGLANFRNGYEYANIDYNGGGTYDDQFNGEVITFNSVTGRRVITTRDFVVGELDDAVTMSFDLSFDQLPGTLTTSQYLVFEFSTDAGITYSTLQTYPELDADVALSSKTFIYDVTDAMRTNKTRFRWRQEESKGAISLNNIGFGFGEVLPFDYISLNKSVSTQALLITSYTSAEVCMGDDITINYEIRGKFGADNVVNVRYQDAAFNSAQISTIDFNITDGTGTIGVKLPSSALTMGSDNGFFKFRLEAYDETNVDYDFSVNGTYSEETVEVVAPINISASFSLDSQQLCDVQDVMAYINNLQDYFTYELFNKADGTSLGTLFYDPEIGDNEINLGPLVDEMEIEMVITSSSSSGDLTCKTITSSYTYDFTADDNYELHVYDYSTGIDELVISGDGRAICEKATSNVLLRLFNPDGSQKTSGIEWFRDDLNTPISTNYYINTTTLSKAGAYFARVTDGSCTYISESYVITNVSKPAIPEITMTGDLGLCDGGDGEVVLEATAGFKYYRWYRNGSQTKTTQSITVDVEGDYYVQVSNVPFEVSCTSSSETIELKTTYSQDVYLYSNTLGDIVDGSVVINECEETLIYFRDINNNTLNANGGIYTAYKDGLEYRTSTNSYIYLEESGEYFIEWTNNALNGVCTTVSSTFTVNIAEIITDLPVITVLSGDLGTCDGDGEIVLEATAGFSYYRWYDGSTLLGTKQSITLDEEGDITVRVSNVPFDAGCYATSKLMKLRTGKVQEFVVKSTTQNVFLSGGETIIECDATEIRFYNLNLTNTITANGGLYTIYLDSVIYNTTTNYYIDLEESGDYFVEWSNDEINGGCVYTSPTFTVDISESIVDAPVITVVSGNLLFCEGEGEVVLSAPAGFSFYNWSGGEVIGQGKQTVTVKDGGTYTVEVSNVPFDLGCSSPISKPVVLREMSSPDFFVRTQSSVDEDNVVDAGTQLRYCDSGTIYFFENNSYTNNGIIVITKDGAEYASVESNNFKLTESGTYSIVKQNSDLSLSCPKSIGNFTVVVDVLSKTVPALTSTGNLEFCATEGSVTLTAPAGSSYYNWFINGSAISSNVQGFDATSNILNVTEDGTYSVQVGNAAGCYGPLSNLVKITVRSLPNYPTSLTQTKTICGVGPVTIRLNNNVYRNQSYQLIDKKTGLPSGAAVTGSTNNNTFLVSDDITEFTEFYVLTSFADGSGCTNFNEDSDIGASPNNVTLVLNGNTLEAEISGYDNWQEVYWYRNSIELVNRRGNTSISITDAAEYSVEVEFDNTCVVTSNSIDLSNVPEPEPVEEALTISSFPNPTTQVLNLEIGGTDLGSYKVTLMTITGQVVLSHVVEKDVREFSFPINMNSVERGVYNLRVSKGGEVKNSRIVKN